MKKEKAQENYEKYMKKSVYQHLGATPKHWQAPKSYSTLRVNMIFLSYRRCRPPH